MVKKIDALRDALRNFQYIAGILLERSQDDRVWDCLLEIEDDLEILEG